MAFAKSSLDSDNSKIEARKIERNCLAFHIIANYHMQTPVKQTESAFCILTVTIVSRDKLAIELNSTGVILETFD